MKKAKSKPKWPPARVFAAYPSKSPKLASSGRAAVVAFQTRHLAVRSSGGWEIAEYRLVTKRKPAKKREGVRRGT